ncbi:hypothetical protein EDE09_10644 [Neorhizobium sp. S3-V5DH]|nr:hypothetical protein EDE09_10644 [Neorhizobium sp. S3-V5DH]
MDLCTDCPTTLHKHGPVHVHSLKEVEPSDMAKGGDRFELASTFPTLRTLRTGRLPARPASA